MAVAYPAGLPQYPVSGYQENLVEATVTNDEVTGPKRTRLRSTTTPDEISVPLKLTDAQVTTLKYYFTTTLNRGMLEFQKTDFGNPDGADYIYKFKTPPKFSWVQNGYWQTELDLYRIRLADGESEPIPDVTPGAGRDHGNLSGLGDDDHTQYSLVDGTRAFTGTVGGVTPTLDAHLATKGYVDSVVDEADVSSLNSLTGAITLAAGSNVTITPAGSTLTIASSASGGSGSIPNALIGDGGTTVTSGSNTTLISSQIDKAIVGTGGNTVVSGSNQVQISGRISNAIVAAGGLSVVSGSNTTILSAQIDKAIVSDSALLVVTSGANTVTLSPDTTPSFTSVDAGTGTFSNTLTISGVSVMHEGITGVTVSGGAVNKGQLNFVGSRGANISISGNTITVDAPAASAAGGGGIAEVSEDTSPTLGGNLDAAGFNITGVGSGDYSTSLTLSGLPVCIQREPQRIQVTATNGTADVTLTNMAAAASLIGGSAARTSIVKIDAGGRTHVRLQGMVTVSGHTTAVIRLRAMKNLNAVLTTVGNYTDVSVTGSVMLNMRKESIFGWQDTGWMPLKPEFQRDNQFFCVATSGGNGALDPSVGAVYWEIR